MFAGHRGVAGEAFEDRDQIRRRGNLRTIRLLGGNEQADGAVGGLGVIRNHTLHIGERCLFDAIAVQEEEPPVAHRGPVAERQGHLLGVVELQLDA